MDYIATSTPKKRYNSRPSLRIQTNVVPELYLSKTVEKQPDSSEHREGGDGFVDTIYQTWPSDQQWDISSQPSAVRYRHNPSRHARSCQFPIEDSTKPFLRETCSEDGVQSSVFTEHKQRQTPGFRHDSYSDLSAINPAFGAEKSVVSQTRDRQDDSSSGCIILKSRSISDKRPSRCSNSNFLRHHHSAYEVTDVRTPSLQLLSRTAPVESSQPRVHDDFQAGDHGAKVHPNLIKLGNSPYYGRSYKTIQLVSPGVAKEKKDLTNRQQQNELLNDSKRSAERSIRLIGFLYHTDPVTRCNLIIMARWFQQWHNNVRRLKIKRQMMAHQMYLANTLDRFSMLKRFFSQWRIKRRSKCCVRKAVRLHQRHLLRKACRAMKWAVSQGDEERERADKTRTRSVLQISFTTWKQQAYSCSQRRWQLKFSVWQRGMELRARCSLFQSSKERSVLCEALSIWKAALTSARQNHLADQHYRKWILHKIVCELQILAAEMKVKRLAKYLAKVSSDRRLKAQIFSAWQTNVRDQIKAKEFKRGTLLTGVLGIWRRKYGVICDKSERRMEVAIQYRSLSLSLRALHIWRRHLLQVKVQHIHKLRTIRKCWLLWKQTWHICSFQRKQCERLQKLNILLKLRLNAHISKQRRQAAFNVIERVLTRRVLQRWWTYYHTKRSALGSEKRIKMEKLGKVKLEMKMVSNYLNLKWAFKCWMNEKQKSVKEKEFSAAVQTELLINQKRRLWTAWRIFAYQRMAIRNSIMSANKKQMLRAFNGWRCVIQRKEKLENHLEYHQAKKTMLTFLSWRVVYLSRIQTKECERMWSNTLQKLHFRRWRSVFIMERLAVELRRWICSRRAFQTWKNQFQLILQIRWNIQNAKRLAKLRQCFSALQLYTVNKRDKKQKCERAITHYKTNLKQQTFTTWKYEYEVKGLSYPPDRPSGASGLSSPCKFPLVCGGQKMRQKVTKNCLKLHLNIWISSFLQAQALKMFRAPKLYKRYFQQWKSHVCQQKKSELVLTRQFHKQHQLRFLFDKWRIRLLDLQDNELKLDKYLYIKGERSVKFLWKVWKRSFVLSRKWQGELYVKRKAFIGWSSWTKGKYDQSLRCRAFQRAVKDRRARHVFEHWKRQHFAIRLQVGLNDCLLMTRSFESWGSLEAHLLVLDDLSVLFENMRKQAVVWKYLMVWRDRLHWSEISTRAQHLLERQTKLRLKKAILQMWKQKYQMTLSVKQ